MSAFSMRCGVGPTHSPLWQRNHIHAVIFHYRSIIHLMHAKWYVSLLASPRPVSFSSPGMQVTVVRHAEPWVRGNLGTSRAAAYVAKESCLNIFLSSILRRRKLRPVYHLIPLDECMSRDVGCCVLAAAHTSAKQHK